MTDHSLDSVFDLSRVPCLALGRVDARSQNGRAEPFVAQDSLQSGGNVMLLGVYRKDLAPPSLCKLPLDLFDQPALFGRNMVFGKVAGFRNHESHFALEFRIELSAIQGPDAVGVIGI